MKKILFYLSILLFLSCVSHGQLYIQNYSFEASWIGGTDIVPPPPNWNNCVCCLDTSIADLTIKNSTLDIYNSLLHNPYDGNTFIGLQGLYYWNSPLGNHYFNVGGEMCNGSFACNKKIFKGHKYKVSVNAYSAWDSLSNPPPQLSMYFGDQSCDTGQRVFKELILNDFVNTTNPIPGWKEYATIFIAKSNWSSILLLAENIYKDTSNVWGKGVATVYLDKLSPLIPDTNYNSIHFPIKQICSGASVFLQSPYPFEEEQYWYAGNELVGTGYGIWVKPTLLTMYTLVIGSDSCVSSVIQTMVSPSCENELIFPTAFTPNNDNDNEVFRPIQILGNKQILNYQIRIYNRLGNKIYSGKDHTKGWDGNGFSIDTYFYVATYNAYNGNLKTVKGTVTLIR